VAAATGKRGAGERRARGAATTGAGAARASSNCSGGGGNGDAARGAKALRTPRMRSAKASALMVLDGPSR
jgi:hypothetical protein